MDTAIMDRKTHSLRSFIPHFSVDDLVLFVGIPLHAENLNLFSIGIYNSYGSNICKIITRNYLL